MMVGKRKDRANMGGQGALSPLTAIQIASKIENPIRTLLLVHQFWPFQFYLKYSFFFKKTAVYTASGLYCIEHVRYPE